MIKKWGKRIKDGDDKTLKKLIYGKHPAYAKSPEISKEQFIKMVSQK